MARKQYRLKGNAGMIVATILPQLASAGISLAQGAQNADLARQQALQQKKLSFAQDQYTRYSNTNDALNAYYDARRNTDDTPDYLYKNGGTVTGKDLHITSGGEKHNLGGGYYLLSGKDNDGIYGYVGNKKTGPKVRVEKDEVIGPSQTKDNSMIVFSKRKGINGQSYADMILAGLDPGIVEYMQEGTKRKSIYNMPPVGRIMAHDGRRIPDKVKNMGYTPGDVYGNSSYSSSNFDINGNRIGSGYYGDGYYNSYKPDFWTRMGMKPYGANYLATGIGLGTALLSRGYDKDNLNFVNEKYGNLYRNLLGGANSAAEAVYVPQQYRDRTAWWELANNNRNFLNRRDNELQNSFSANAAIGRNQEAFNDKLLADAKTLGESRKSYLDWSDAERRTMAQIAAENASSKNQLMAAKFNSAASLLSNWMGDRMKVGDSNINLMRNVRDSLINYFINPSMEQYQDEQELGIEAMMGLAQATDSATQNRLRELLPYKWRNPRRNKYLHEHYGLG